MQRSETTWEASPLSSALTIFIAYALGTLSLVCNFFDPYSGIFGALFKFVVLFITGTSLINVYARKDTLANTSEHNYYSYLESHGIMRNRPAARHHSPYTNPCWDSYVSARPST